VGDISGIAHFFFAKLKKVSTFVFLLFELLTNFRMFSKLKTFLSQGDALTLAVGVVIGGAFGKIVSAIVDKIFGPLLGLISGGINFADKGLELKAAVAASEGVAAVPALVLGWGELLQSCIGFVMTGIALYFFLKAMGKNPGETPPPAPTPANEVLLAEIRDLLKR
jgi:large conductance mechanosensitive channel